MNDPISNLNDTIVGSVSDALPEWMVLPLQCGCSVKLYLRKPGELIDFCHEHDPFRPTG